MSAMRISHAPIATHYVVIARTGSESRGRNISAFVVPAGRITESLDITAPHSIGSVAFEECRIPGSCLLGADGDASRSVMSTLDVFGRAYAPNLVTFSM